MARSRTTVRVVCYNDSAPFAILAVASTGTKMIGEAASASEASAFARGYATGKDYEAQQGVQQVADGYIPALRIVAGLPAVAVPPAVAAPVLPDEGATPPADMAVSADEGKSASKSRK